MTQKTNQNPWTMDVRVRERNLKSGALTDKDLEKNLAGLPDLADQAEPFGIPQPALAQPPHVAEVVEPEEEEEEEEDEEVGEPPQPEVSAEAQPQQPAQPEQPQAEEPAAEVGGGGFTNGEGQQS